MKCQQNMEFIEQAIVDYSNTLSASARAAFVLVAQQHLGAVIKALAEPSQQKDSGESQTQAKV
ncbi:hypothetical protein [Microbulbifer thermotolerans]|uniref:hypothetical protein n=1 Tax=Microbulbifer thermotolerans TaxID=252514 RepID=UPI00224B1A47|nr:hypothetical protein [Microbulbifer thermotolerans]MCX2834448.1 hypothetical protein [Microbulbifer thermotolerans]